MLDGRTVWPWERRRGPWERRAVGSLLTYWVDTPSGREDTGEGQYSRQGACQVGYEAHEECGVKYPCDTSHSHRCQP
jgi:hypothetical protein